jgi:RNA polymerase sigma-70 factor (ECF subfamily)
MTEVRDNIIEMLPHLRAFARSLTASPTDAEDLVSDTIVRALQAEHRFQPGSNLRSWLFTIERNIFMNYCRSHRVRAIVHTAVPEEGTADPMLQVPAAQDAAVHFTEALRAWPKIGAKHRQAVAYLACGWENAAAAATIGIPCGTLKSRAARGRQQLAAMIGRYA